MKQLRVFCKFIDAVGVRSGEEELHQARERGGGLRDDFGAEDVFIGISKSAGSICKAETRFADPEGGVGAGPKGFRRRRIN